MINAVVGVTLFAAYTTTEASLSKRLDRKDSALNDALLLPFASGAAAGAAQSVISAPLDNARHVLLQRNLSQHHGGTGAATTRRRRGQRQLFRGWLSFLRETFTRMPSSAPLAELSAAGSASAATQRSARVRAIARRAWSLFSLSLVRDSVGFGAFFMTFEVGRRVARHVANVIDGVRLTGQDDAARDAATAEHVDVRDILLGRARRRHSTTALVAQAVLLLASGTFAGFMYAVVGRPFERARAVISDARATWAARATGAVLRPVERRKTRRSLIRVARAARSWRRRRRLCVRRPRHVIRSHATRQQHRERMVSRWRLSYARRAQQQPLALPSRPPSALDALRAHVKRHGLAQTFLTTPSTPQLQPRGRTPQRLSYVGHTHRVAPRLEPPGLRACMARVSGAAARSLFKYAPPYAIGLLVWAIASGDLG